MRYRRVLHTSSESLPSASRSTISITSSYIRSPAEYPCAQLFPAPPPSFDTKMFSGLYRFAYGEDRIPLMTLKTAYIHIANQMQGKDSDILWVQDQQGLRVECSARRRPDRRRRPCGRRLPSPSPRGCPPCLCRVQHTAAASRRNPLSPR